MSQASFIACMIEAGIDIDNRYLSKLINDLGDNTSLSEGLKIAKGLILNYFCQTATARAICKEIDDLDKEYEHG
jgi:hypothetical protein